MKSKPFLRWAGSKTKLVPKLRRYWTAEHNRYVEPFMGSAALFFEISPSSALLSDINPCLVETFCAVRDHPRAVYNRLKKIPLGEKAYYGLRAIDDSDLPFLDRAARFIFLNRFCFNGLYRTNKAGKFNVPFASAKTGNLPELNELYSISKSLKHVDIRARDFEQTLLDVQPRDLVYMDPPYAVRNRRIFRQYGPDSFGLDDLSRLSHLLPEIDNKGATFLISYALCKEALEMFDGWHIRRVHTQRSIAGFSKHRRKAVEIFVSNRESCEL